MFSNNLTTVFTVATFASALLLFVVYLLVRKDKKKK